MNEEIISQLTIQKARKVKLLLMDCDGVLTDGRLYFSGNGEELKVFHVHDGQGIVNWHEAGYRSGIITGRKSKILERRVEELGIHYLIQSSTNKLRDFRSIIKEIGITSEEVAYIGDDIADLELLGAVGFPAAVADCRGEVRSSVVYRTKSNGGCGAVRELVDFMLTSKS